MNDLESTQRDARILQERRGTAAHPRRGFMAELTREDRHWIDLREQRAHLRREHIILCYYKPRYLEILDEEGRKVERIRIPPEGLSEAILYDHLRACGYPTRLLRARIRRRGGAYYGCETFKAPRGTRLEQASEAAPPAPPDRSTPAPAPPSPSPATTPPGGSGWDVLFGVLGVAVVGVGSYALLSEVRSARAREARQRDRDLLLERRDEILAALARRPRCSRCQEAAQRLARLTPDDQAPDDLMWILELWLELQRSDASTAQPPAAPGGSAPRHRAPSAGAS